ncbi:MAG: helix-turn-helix transcriptional regulator [Lachnospiraceae bacterium]|nr:helix-turn-helix transcriptional regulator [Lachnospiraceae bacterium]
MKTRRTLQEKLRDLRYNNGNMKLEQLSEKTGISTTALSSYETDEIKDVPHTAIITLAKFYGVSTDYLLGFSENEKKGGTSLQDLHINDAAVSLLSSDRINNRLLCELITHPSFVRLMSDLEIYIDGHAGTMIQSLNAQVDVLRMQIEKESNDAEKDKILDMLQTSHIEDDAYFFNIINHDLDEIAKDIRIAHAKDADNAPDNLLADTIKDNFKMYEKAVDLEAAPKDNFMNLLVMYFLKELRMREDFLSKEENTILRNVIARSPRYKDEVRKSNKSRRKKK